MARTKPNKNNGVKIKDKGTSRSTRHDNPAIAFITNFPVDCPTEFPLITALLELSALSNKKEFYPDSFLYAPFLY